jgi:hypothetical protein
MALLIAASVDPAKENDSPIDKFIQYNFSTMDKYEDVVQQVNYSL